LEKLAGIEGQYSNEKQISWLESERETTEVQRSKEKEKQKEERLDGKDKGKKAEIREQEEENGIEDVEEGSSRFSSAVYSIGTRAL